jgi:mycothione reductase
MACLAPREDEEVANKFTEIFSKKYNIYLGYNTDSASKDEVGSGNDGHLFRVTAKRA